MASFFRLPPIPKHLPPICGFLFSLLAAKETAIHVCPQLVLDAIIDTHSAGNPCPCSLLPVIWLRVAEVNCPSVPAYRTWKKRIAAQIGEPSGSEAGQQVSTCTQKEQDKVLDIFYPSVVNALTCLFYL